MLLLYLKNLKIFLDNEHKSIKKDKYSNLIVDYVNNNTGCSLYDINKDIKHTDNTALYGLLLLATSVARYISANLDLRPKMM